MPTIQLVLTEDEALRLQAKCTSMGFSGIDPYLRFLAFPPKWVQTPEQKAAKLVEKVKWFVESHTGGCARCEIARFIGGQAKSPQVDAAITSLLDAGRMTAKRERRSRKTTNYYYITQ